LEEDEVNTRIVIGSISAIILLLFASFSSTVCAQTSKPPAFFNHIQKNVEAKEWYPGAFILYLLYLAADISQYFYEQTGHFSPILTILGVILESTTTIGIFALFILFIFLLMPFVVLEGSQPSME